MKWLQKKTYRVVRWCLNRKWVKWALEVERNVILDDFEKNSGAKWGDWQCKALVQGKRRWEAYILYGRAIGSKGVSNDFASAVLANKDLR